jgi:hypothetical protein
VAGWLILVLTEEIPASERARIEDAAADVRNVLDVSIVRPEELSELKLPITE